MNNMRDERGIQQFPPPLLPINIPDEKIWQNMLQQSTQLQAQGKSAESLQYLRSAMIFNDHHVFKDAHHVALTPNSYRDAYMNLLGLAIEARHFEMSVAVARRLFIEARDDKEKFLAGLNFSKILARCGRFDKARAVMQQLEESPILKNHPHQQYTIWTSFADWALQQNRFDEVVRWIEKLAPHQKSLQPFELVDFYRLATFGYLYVRDYQKGFEYYEQRGMMADPAFPYFPPHPKKDEAVAWQGEKAEHLLIIAEQGLGDSIQFVRFLSAIKDYKLAHQVTLAVAGVLGPLLVESPVCQGNDDVKIQVRALRDPLTNEKISHWLYLPSLPYILQSKVQLSPAVMQKYYQPQTPYIGVKSSAPISLPSSGKKYKVGLVWATSVGGPSSTERTMTLADLLPLLTDKDICQAVDFYSLQVGDDQRSIGREGMAGALFDLAPMIKSFADTARLLYHMDGLIAVDTAINHVSGGLGDRAPVTFVLLPHRGEWRWSDYQMEKQDELSPSYWYPLRHWVVKQQNKKDWQGAVQIVKKYLLDFLKKKDKKG